VYYSLIYSAIFVIVI